MGRGAADEFDFSDVQRSGIASALADPPTREELEAAVEALAPGESYSFENGASVLRRRDAGDFLVRWPSEAQGFRASESEGAVSDALAFRREQESPSAAGSELQAIELAYQTRADTWVPASKGQETPVRYRDGRTLLYCFNPARQEHAYLDVEQDRILSADEARMTVLF